MRKMRVASLGTILAAAIVALGAADPAPLPVTSVESVGFTVSNMDRALDFYTRVLPFTKEADVEAAGRAFELLSGVFGARARIVRLRLGDERLELTEFLTPRGRPISPDFRPNDRSFQHVAIIVSNMDKAYARLRANGVEHASSSPQRLPDWNPQAGGIKAFYFRDPDRHFLEILQFPAGKGATKWQARNALFLGIDHTAIVVRDTDASLDFYRGVLGLTIAGESENYDVEQEHLNGVFGARLRITALRAREGPGIEFLEYLAPSDGRPAPDDLRANDIAHWQTTLATSTLEPLLPLARAHKMTLVSPGPVDVSALSIGYRAASLTRDPDGHGLMVVAR